MRLDDVTACLVTRGDQPRALERILDSLIFERVVVWDNSTAVDWKVAGRYAAALTVARTPYVYFQDDDVLVPGETQADLMLEYDGSVECVANWGHGATPDGYDDLPLVCGGAITSRLAIFDAITRYAAHYPLDEAFQYEADFVVGALYRSFRHVELDFVIDLEIAQAPERLCNQPWQRELKLEITNRARALREVVIA